MGSQRGQAGCDSRTRVRRARTFCSQAQGTGGVSGPIPGAGPFPALCCRVTRVPTSPTAVDLGCAHIPALLAVPLSLLGRPPVSKPASWVQLNPSPRLPLGREAKGAVALQFTHFLSGRSSRIQTRSDLPAGARKGALGLGSAGGPGRRDRGRPQHRCIRGAAGLRLVSIYAWYTQPVS